MSAYVRSIQMAKDELTQSSRKRLACRCPGKRLILSLLASSCILAIGHLVFYYQYAEYLPGVPDSGQWTLIQYPMLSLLYRSGSFNLVSSGSMQALFCISAGVLVLGGMIAASGVSTTLESGLAILFCGLVAMAGSSIFQQVFGLDFRVFHLRPGSAVSPVSLAAPALVGWGVMMFGITIGSFGRWSIRRWAEASRAK